MVGIALDLSKNGVPGCSFETIPDTPGKVSVTDEVAEKKERKY